MKLSTTFDFNDFAMVYGGPEGYYTLAQFDEDIRRLVQEAGIRKINIRTDCCGLTNHPSKVVPMFGDYGCFNWNAPQNSLRLIQTMVHYDCCAEFVRICHKYGAEAWAWEGFCDDGGISIPESATPEFARPARNRKNGWCGLDEFYMTNMDALAKRDPFRMPTPERTAHAQAQVREKGIGKIVIVNHPEWTGVLKPPKETRENMLIYISDDNKTFRLYDGPWDFIADQTDDGCNRIVLYNMDIRSPYLKLRCEEGPNRTRYTMVLRYPEGQVKVYDKEGAEIQFGFAVNGGFLESSPVDFRSVRGNASWDQDGCIGQEYLAGAAGPADLPPYLFGFAEYNVPKAMEHKVARFEELTHYDFDGFIFNTRSHSGVNFADQYGFNPEVLTKFAEQHGHEYNGSEEDKAGIFQIRAEGYTEYFRRCKATTGGRPLFMSAPMPLEYAGHPAYNITFGPMPWEYRKLISEGIIDGVIMIGKNFENGVDYSSYFTPEVTGGRKITIGIFREMLGRPEGYDLADDMAALWKTNLDEIELYESKMLLENPMCYRFINNQAKPGEKMDWNYTLYGTEK